MKKLMAFGLLLSTVNSFAFYVGGNGNINASGTVASVTVCNHFGSNRPMSCNIGAEGMTISGHVLFSHARTLVMPGQCSYAYVYTNHYNRFVSVNGGANCYWH